jgi:serine/threonine-protein kinase
VSPAKPKIAQIGPYEVLEELGRGAMGVVFRGFDPSIARPVAIKVIRPQQFETQQQSEEARQRFAREANAAGRLSHNNIVTVYQLGEDRGYQYLAMEFIDGKSLNKVMQPGIPMDAEVAVSILRQIAEGLDHAHSQGVVHRDVKPANILIRNDRTVKIADFGIAHIAAQTLTQQGTTLGTPAYMSPEQIQGLKVEGKADQFSLAVLAYQMLSGKRPFDAANEQNLILEIMSSAPKPIHEVNPALRPRCSAVLERGMAKDAAARYPTCSDLIRELTASIMEPEPEPAVVEPPPSTARTARGKSLWIGVGVGVLAAAGVGAFVLTHSPAPARSKSPLNVSAPAAVAAAPVQPATKEPVKTAPESPVTNESRAVKEPRPVPPTAKEPSSMHPIRAVASKPPAQPAKQPPALTPDQLKAKYEREQKIAALDARRQQLQGEVLQAQRDLDGLRERYKDSYPDVQTAIERVQTLRNSLNDVTNQLIDLKSQQAAAIGSH